MSRDSTETKQRLRAMRVGQQLPSASKRNYIFFLRNKISHMFHKTFCEYLNNIRVSRSNLFRNIDLIKKKKSESEKYV